MLRIADVNERKVALMAAMDKFYLVDTSASDPAAKPIVASDGSFPALTPGHTYQVFKGLSLHLPKYSRLIIAKDIHLKKMEKRRRKRKTSSRG